MKIPLIACLFFAPNAYAATNITSAIVTNISTSSEYTLSTFSFRTPDGKTFSSTTPPYAGAENGYMFEGRVFEILLSAYTNKLKVDLKLDDVKSTILAVSFSTRP